MARNSLKLKINPAPFNPVAVREMKTRMRGARTFGLLAIYMLVLGLIVYLVYLRKGGTTAYSYGGTFNGGNFGPTRSFETGQDLFISIFVFLLTLTAIITPAICGGLISREMEEGTYDMLVVTPLRGRALIYGKLLGALTYIGLLLLASVPLVCVVFLFGGVDFGDIMAGYAIVLLQAVVFSVISLFLSGLFRRTSVTIVISYSLIALFLLGVPVLSNSMVASLNNEIASRSSSSSSSRDPRVDSSFDVPKRVLVLNSFAALGSVLAPNAPYRPSNSEDLQYFPNSRLFWGSPSNYYATPNLNRDPERQRIFELSRQPVLPGGIPLWQGYIIIYLAIALLFLILSVGVVKPQPRQAGFRLGSLRKFKLSRKNKQSVPVATVLDSVQSTPEIPASATVDPTSEQPTNSKRIALG